MRRVRTRRTGRLAISYLGIDIGGTKVALRAETDGAEAVRTAFHWAPNAAARADLAELVEQVGTLAARLGEPIESVGVATPATLDAQGCVVAWPNRPSWVGHALSSELAALFDGTPVHTADDGDLAAVAEAAAAGCCDLLYVGVGTGVGGGIVSGGRAIPGTGRGSCELGHVVVALDGPRCDCGRTGCVQALASGPAVLRQAGVPFDELRAGLEADQPWTRQAIVPATRALAAAITGVAELTRPELVLVGGGFAMGLPGFVAEVGQRVAGLARAGHRQPPVRAAALGGVSSLHGAVLLARDPAIAG
ncbi:MAG TPA: ROK family protein [Pseudonocardiaceae bacterium]|nr:ROK family protein [Pseudonocardiaceae bacterium]